MKNTKFNLLAIFALFILMSSCSKDAETGLVGTWDTSDGGTITFNSDGTGMTSDSPFFLFGCGTITINGVSETLGPVEKFNWTIVENESITDNVQIEYDDQTSFSSPCSGVAEWPVNVKSKKRAVIGVALLGIDVELTK